MTAQKRILNYSEKKQLDEWLEKPETKHFLETRSPSWHDIAAEAMKNLPFFITDGNVKGIFRDTDRPTPSGVGTGGGRVMKVFKERVDKINERLDTLQSVQDAISETLLSLEEVVQILTVKSLNGKLNGNQIRRLKELVNK